MDVRPRRERLEETPFGRGQVLEAVRQDGAPVPGVELAGQAPDRIPAESAAIPCAEALELVPVPADETRERFGEIVAARRARRRPRRGCVRTRPRTPGDDRSACPCPRRPGGAGCAARSRRAASERRRFRPRAPRTGSRTSRRCPPGGRCSETLARAPRGRPRRGSARSATGRGRSRPRTGRAGARPSRRVPDRRRGTDPPEHGSRADFPPRLTAGTGIGRKRRSQRRSDERLRLAPAARDRRARHPART